MGRMTGIISKWVKLLWRVLFACLGCLVQVFAKYKYSRQLVVNYLCMIRCEFKSNDFIHHSCSSCYCLEGAGGELARGLDQCLFAVGPVLVYLDIRIKLQEIACVLILPVIILYLFINSLKMCLDGFLLQRPIQQKRTPKHSTLQPKHHPLIRNHPTQQLHPMRKCHKQNIQHPETYRQIPFRSFECFTHLIERRWQIVEELSVGQFDLLGKCIEIMARDVTEALIRSVKFGGDPSVHMDVFIFNILY